MRCVQGLAAALASWSAFARQQDRLQTVAARIVHRGMAAALTSWRDYVRRMAGARALLWRVVAGRKQLCWDAWWQHATQVQWWCSTSPVVACRRNLQVQGSTERSDGTEHRKPASLTG